MIKSETDALVRQLRGYIRVFLDPPRHESRKPTETRELMAKLFASEFTTLDKLLCDGDPIPEEWDRKMLNTYRTRKHPRKGDFWYVYPPGHDEAACQAGQKKYPCKWLNSNETLSVCQRCHTIRIKFHD